MLKGYFSICIYIEETIILEEMLYGKLKKKDFYSILDQYYMKLHIHLGIYLIIHPYRNTNKI